MGMNDTPTSERKHIAFFGCRNAGKSSLLNAVTGQNFAIVSDVLGTTTDPVYKAMELLPAGPVVVIDTPGLDDVGDLGKMRIEKAVGVLRKTDLAILVVDSSKGFSKADEDILSNIAERKIPAIIVSNKSDISESNNGDSISDNSLVKNSGCTVMKASATTKEGIHELKEKIAALLNEDSDNGKVLVGDLINAGDIVVLVVPIDKAAPKGRLILPQQQTIRDLLDHGAIPIVCRDSELQCVIDKYASDIKLVITDSQAFKKVGEIVPDNIPLTSFSILFSRYKGELEHQLAGVDAVRDLKDGDYVLIAEGCTHHRQCGDIGTEKIPAMLRKKANVQIDFTQGTEYPSDLSKYKVIIHCGGCMLNEKEMKARISLAKEAGVPITNYGMTIAFITGILERSMKPILNK
ncbi:MAG: [FeFe] hydrogenase H-cluster maturation GTPase HydF [Lachnospiraceae bacterium]|nr:[FeFe] hydrogenase H-cluster maturation GTPase HydF [Lachnospiraceae bacterium]MBP5564369.1 [FeFe] hydrogenase H-cluster maturation GTPase HydF [Lachnospiraceae bacterium]